MLIFQPELQDRLPLFLQAWWLDLLAPDRWTYFTDAAEDEATVLWPVVLQKKWGIRIGTMACNTQFLGPYPIRHEINDAELALGTAKIHQKHISGKMVTVKQSMQLQPGQLNALKKLGWQFRERVTYKINTSVLSESDMWEGLKSTRCRRVRAAEKVLLCVEGGFDKHVETIFNQTYSHRKLQVPFPARLIYTIYEKASSRGRGFILQARRQENGPTLAFGLFVHDAQHLYYLIGGADRSEDPKGLAGSLVLWNALKRAQLMGIDFDFEGSMVPGIAAFFKSFGAKPHTYYNGLWDRWPILRKMIIPDKNRMQGKIL